MRNTLIILSAIFMILSCTKNSQKKLGLTENMPDEYKVKRNKALEVPPGYNLPSQEKRNISELAQAEQALLNEIE